MTTLRILTCAFVIAAGSCAQQASPAGGVPSSPSATDLLAAVDSGDLRDVDRLIGKRANLDARVGGDGTALILASRQGKLAIVDALLKAGAGADVASPGDGNPLIMAAKAGHASIVKRLMDAGADPNAIVPGDETPLINAAREGHLDIVEYLVDHGADVNLGVTADFGQWRSPLNQAGSEAIRTWLRARGASAGRAPGA